MTTETATFLLRFQLAISAVLARKVAICFALRNEVPVSTLPDVASRSDVCHSKHCQAIVRRPLEHILYIVPAMIVLHTPTERILPLNAHTSVLCCLGYPEH